MSSCAPCISSCSDKQRATYARACLSALLRDQGYPECPDRKEKGWIDGGEMKDEYRRLKRLEGPDAVPASFDQRRAFDMAERVYARIDAFYVTGALEWARTAVPGLFSQQSAAALTVDRAFASEDMEQIKAALGELDKAMRAICTRFEEARTGAGAGVVPCALKCTMSIRHDYNFNILDLESQKVDAESAPERASQNPLASFEGDRRLSDPSNSQQLPLQGFALDKSPRAVMKEKLKFRANEDGAAWS